MITAESSSVIPFAQFAHTDHRPNGGSAGRTSGAKLTYFAECGAFVQKDWILKNVIARGETSGWIAPPGHGKSALLTEIAVHCAAGRDWRGHKAKDACGVVILALERADLCKRRLHAYAVRDGFDELPIAICSGTIDLMNAACVETIASIVQTAERGFGCCVGLLIIDTFSKGIAAGGGDEDRARDQNQVAANLRHVQDLLGVHIALVGHTGKNETRGARGSNAHLGDVDLMVQISGGDIKVAEITKANDQPERVLTRFRLEQIGLGHDEDGDPITTAIVSTDLVSAAAAPKARDPKLTPNQRTMFEILLDAGATGLATEDWDAKGKDAGIGFPRRADLGDARRGLKHKKLVREYADRWTVDHCSP
ncbi:AAA family ATPase [Bradyrhizobium guangzhouense]|uniref:AAA family ATPase n=1 Tax=Bradyrhizobium guangzhouense TaxID=1325095 RepID=UPI001009E180|nr:AAA family ATPase [Bradyrhizobium guangzhouense]RXH15233.1 hypothetical protein EAS54_19345 [Bradyrhizobium guangzhouense]